MVWTEPRIPRPNPVQIIEEMEITGAGAPFDGVHVRRIASCEDQGLSFTQIWNEKDKWIFHGRLPHGPRTKTIVRPLDRGGNGEEKSE